MIDKEANDPDKPCRGRPREFDRQKALYMALRLFWEQGYLQTTMSQLCNAMGIKSPSLYCAFGNKAELFLEALAYYKKTYWHGAFEAFLAGNDLYADTLKLFEETARILLLPDAPCGCLTVFSALTLPPSETGILATIANMRMQTRLMFKKKLQSAIENGQIAPDINLSAFAGALTNFFEGLTLQARDKNMTFEELLPIARCGLKLLPPAVG